jgi:peptidoglycan/LPS O-acetylase OafA/YrhL
MPNSTVNKGSSRFAELDGLRALAVMSVILFHSEISGAFNAGFFGVDIFFTISGFLITAILLREYQDTGGIQFFRFYFRRLKRLLPPVLALIVFAFVLTLAISESAFTKLKADVPAGLLYASNWWQIAEKQSYFDKTPHVLKHLWSLAVEEQFYIVWPIVAYGLLKNFGRKTTGTVSLMLALLSTAWMWYLYDLNIDGGDQNRIYLGTDTHAMGLLMGAALACFWNPWAPAEESPAARRSLRAAALLSLATLGYMIQAMNESDPAMYRGSFLVVPILTCAVAYCAMNDPGFMVSRFLRTRIIQWIGLRSYSLYLVHWVVLVSLRLLDVSDLPKPMVLATGLAIVAGLSELMYRYVESPSIRFDPKNFGIRPMAFSITAYTIAAALLFLVTGVAPDEKNASTLAGVPAAAAADNPGLEMVAEPAAQETAGETAGLPDKSIDSGEMISGGEDIHAIGDSVLLGASAYLSRKIPGILIDAAVGRQASQGLKVVKQWHSNSDQAATVLVHLGTNGYINEAQFRDLLRELADRKSVIVINVHADRRWTAPNNEIIERMTHEFPNIHLIDWNAVSSQRPEYFVKDGIHLTRKGILALTSEIKLVTGGTVILPEVGTGIMLADARRPHRPPRKVEPAEIKSPSAIDVTVIALAETAAAPEPASAPPISKIVAEMVTEAVAQPSPVLLKVPQIE